MQALAIDKYGSAAELKLQEIATPEPGPLEVRIQVHAASINPIDWKVRSGDFKLLMSRKFPRVVGCDFAGVVDKVGSSVEKFKAGDTVFGLCNPMKARYGSYAQYAIVGQDTVALKPGDLSFTDAASLPVAGLTALRALKLHMQLKEGQSVLINGASGGVGTFAVQIAKALGIRVIATCGKRNMEFVKELGAAEVYDYAAQDLSALTEKFDGIFDASAKLQLSKVKHLFTQKGSFVTTVPNAETLIAACVSALLPVRKVYVVMAGSGAHVEEELNELAQMVVSRQMKPIITQTTELGSVPEIHREGEKGHTRGKIVIRIAD